MIEHEKLHVNYQNNHHSNFLVRKFLVKSNLKQNYLT